MSPARFSITLPKVISRLLKEPKLFHGLISFGFLLLGLFVLRDLFGQVWKTGALSVVFVPVIGPLLGDLFAAGDNYFLTSVTIFAYIGGSISAYFFVWYLNKRTIPAVLTGLLMFLPLFPFSQDTPMRLQQALLNKDGAHVIAAALMPVVLLLYIEFTRTHRKKLRRLFYILSIITGLISFLGFLILLLFMVLVSISEALIGQGKQKVLVFVKLGGVVLLALVGIYNFSLVPMLVSEQGSAAFAFLGNLIPITIVVTPVFAIFAFLLFDRRPKQQPVFIAVTFSLFSFLATLAGDFLALPQNRFAVEARFSSAFLFALILTAGYDFLLKDESLLKYPQLAANRTRIANGYLLIMFVALLGSLLFIPRAL
ncbi:hypothetical protein C4579_02580 [Candidatus Microgenomates bacterium]|nr:MAG: hypothetical protein C4579_02580 [Candidatus Microgenomates bacterium]